MQIYEYLAEKSLEHAEKHPGQETVRVKVSGK